jgi:uncharacterized protein YndB with AHSA1/START domain
MTAMLQAENVITIRRPARDIFDYLADGTHNAHWRDGVVEIRRTSAGGGAGATYRQVLSGPGGRHIDGDYQITAYDPPARLEFEVTAGPARPAGVFEIRDDGTGSARVSFTLRLQPTGMMKLMSPMITRQLRHEVAQLARLKAIMESAPATGTG